MKTNIRSARTRTECNEGNEGRIERLACSSSLSSFPFVQNAFRNRHKRLRFERLEERTVLSSFAVSFGGEGNDYPRPVGATDPSENSYLTGRFASQPADFDPGPEAYNLSSVGSDDVFIAKYSPDGSFAWARSFGGPESDTGIRTEFSREGTGDYVYLAGSFRSTVDFGPGFGVRSSAGETDHFLLKLNADTGATVWGVQLSGPSFDAATDLTVSNGMVYVVGGFSGAADFDPGPGAAVLDSANGANFAWALDQQGNYISAWQLNAHIASVEVDDDNLYLRGQFTGTADFDPGPGEALRTSNVGNNLWFAKYSLSGTFGWFQSIDVQVLTSGTMAQDSASLYIAVTDVLLSSTADVIVASINKLDGTVRWSQRFGDATGYEYTTTCAINPETGALYVGGIFTTPILDFNPSASGGEVYNQGYSDGFILKLRADTGAYQQVWQIGGSGATEYARVHDARGSRIYVSSSFAGTAVFPSGDTLTSHGGYQGGNDGYLLVIDETDALPPPPPATKFYVVNDATQNRTYEYGGGGAAVENYMLNFGNTAPRGAASTAAGDKVWVVDANKKVYIYSHSGSLLGSWTAGSLPGSASVQGVTTNGTDVWIVDAKSDKVYKYAGAASRVSGSQNAASSFSLNTANRDPSDLVTDGTSTWVLNNTTFADKVFKYTVGGVLLGSWEITYAGGSPTGITIDPTNVNDIWIVDNATDRIYPFSGAANRTSGFQNPGLSFPLAAGNTNPQGIADPPAPSQAQIASEGSAAEIANSRTAAHDAALLDIAVELSTVLTKRRK